MVRWGRGRAAARMRAELRREHDAHPGAARRVRDHDAGGRAHDERRDLRDETIADGEDGVLRERLTHRQTFLHDADEDAAHDVDRRDEEAGDRVALHELGRAVHRAVEVRLSRDLQSATTSFLLVDEAGAQIGVDRHLLAGHGVQGESRGHLRHASRALGNDDEVDADENQEQHEPHGIVAADHELAERLNDRAGVPLAENEPRAADAERESKERQKEQERREAAELERVRRVQRDQHHDERHADARRQQQVEKHAGQRHHQQRDDEQDGEREAHLGVAPAGALEHRDGGDGGAHASALPCQLPRVPRVRSTKARTSATAI